MNKKQLATIITLALLSLNGFAEEAKTETKAAGDQSNNPLANMRALNFHNYYTGKKTEMDDASGNTFWIRYAQPVKIGDGSWLLRTSLPTVTKNHPKQGVNKTGIGNFNIFMSYLFEMPNPAVSVGLGPMLTMPALSDEVGSEKWSAGFAHVVFDARSAKLQKGYLLTWQHSFAGSGDTVNAGAFQPFGFFQLGQGLYLRSSAIWTYNFENDGYTVPVGLGVGKVFKTESVTYNLFLEPEYSVLNKGKGHPEWQVFMALNLQFPGK